MDTVPELFMPAALDYPTGLLAKNAKVDLVYCSLRRQTLVY